MNYIRHISAFFDLLHNDKRFSPSHVSLYMALFQCWNLSHFANTFSINKNQVLKWSKIGSEHTYYRNISDLHDWGFIEYYPSFHSSKGSRIKMIVFEFDETAKMQSDTAIMQPKKDEVQNIWTAKMQGLDCKNAVPELHICSPGTAKMQSSLNINKTYKTYSGEKTQNEIQNLISKNQNSIILKSPSISKRKKVAPKKESSFVKPQLEEIMNYFIAENYPEIEAHKFFNHFESNGWKVGGKTPMKNWQAAARNWMLNAQNFITPKTFPNFQKPQPRPKPDPNNKNYAEPL